LVSGAASKNIDYYWRFCATAFCFAVFGLCGLVFGLIVFPLMRIIPGSPTGHRRRVRTTFLRVMHWFVNLMRGVGVLTYEFEGAERLGRPGQMVMGESPHAHRRGLPARLHAADDVHCQTGAVQERIHALAGRGGGVRPQHADVRHDRAGCSGPSRRSKCNNIPEGTRTTPGQALQFQRGAASIAVRAASVITPVFIRCEPTTLAKHMPWYRIPPRRVRITFRVGEDIDPRQFRHAPAPLASRALNEHLLKVFEAELKTGGQPASAGLALETRRAFR